MYIYKNLPVLNISYLCIKWL